MEEFLEKYRWFIEILNTLDKKLKRKVFNNLRLVKKDFYPKGEYKADIKNLLNCMLCPNMCRFDCGSLLAANSEAMSPAYKARIGYFLTTGTIDPSKPENKEFIDLMYMCTNEENCLIHCPFDFSVVSLLETVRDDINAKGLMPDYAKPVLESLKKYDTPENENIYITYKDKGIENINTDGHDEVYYYIGCEMMKFPEVVKANITILKKAGVKFSTNLDSKMCCGSPAFNIRDMDTAISFAERNKQLIESTGAPLVVSDCPGCVETLTKKYQKNDVNIQPKIIHIVQYISQLLDEGKINFSRSLPSDFSKITIHDPCLLSRNQGDTNSLRNIIKHLSGVELVEPIYNKESVHCCGWSGTLHWAARYISTKEAQNRIDELKETGANRIATSCPLCEIGLSYGIQEDDQEQLKVIDISELIAKAL